jgi:hypothetical protein
MATLREEDDSYDGNKEIDDITVDASEHYDDKLNRSYNVKCH